jgi:hypothetical protein
MEPGHYTNPLEEAVSHGSQRVAQLASLVGAMAQVVIQRRALHDARTAARDDQHAARIINEQERLLHQQARLGWSPVHDARWLARADLLETGRAWASAASHADTDPTAASALRKCEDRLRTLHPHAMARYDRLRADGMDPLDAMRDTAPLFSRSPDVRVGDPVPVPSALAANASQDGMLPTEQAQDAPPDHGPDPDDSAEARGRQIITRMQSTARASGHPDPGPDELAITLEAATNLPQHVIDKITRQAATDGQASSHQARVMAAAHGANVTAAIDLAGTTGGDLNPVPIAMHSHGTSPSQASQRSSRSVAQLAAECFPHSATDAVQAVSTAKTTRPARLSTTPGITNQPGGPA